MVLAAAILSVMGRSTLSPGIVGLAVSHSLQVGNSSKIFGQPHMIGKPIRQLLKKNYIAGNWDLELDCAGMDRCRKQHCVS